MIEPAAPSERNLPVSPQLALRVAILGALALALFAIVFFRLWYLQVLSGTQYRQEATVNTLRTLPIAAPRGEILDRSGHVLATDRPSYVVQIVPDQLPAPGAPRKALYRRLAHVIGVPWRQIEDTVVTQRRAQPKYADITIQVDASYAALTVLQEHQLDFPGVDEAQVQLRDYPNGALAPQVVGYVGQINSNELGHSAFRGIPQGTVIGQDGIEAAYDSYLLGKAGKERLKVNAAGQYVGSESSVAPVAGHSVKLTVDSGLQQAGDNAMQTVMGQVGASAGAFVAMDPRTGAVLALGSFPTYNPNVLVRPFTQKQYDALLGNSSTPGAFTDRAIDGLYPTGSTFKPITAMAGLESGIITPSTAMGGGQCVSIGTANQQFCNSGKANDGDLDLESALKVSEDTYFYELGAQANSHGAVIQKMAKYLGLGRPTGIDLPGETDQSVVPDRAWLNRENALERACERRKHVPSCFITDGNPWTIGDNVNLAVGQGDLLATPLQMATVYSTLANVYMNGNGRGIVPVPHLVSEIDDANGRLVQQIQPPSPHHVHLDASDLSVVMAGLHDATSQPGGTSADVWAGFPKPVFGKTGTAQHGTSGVYGADQSWYDCYIPDGKHPIEITVTIEKGGFGASAAAPVARLIASEWFHVPPKLIRGSNSTL
jgi:penicillin-binding protein 2